MKIVRSKKYTKSLQEALSFIARDSRQRALNFKRELDEHINNLDNMPFKCRQSIYFKSRRREANYHYYWYAKYARKIIALVLSTKY